jgi:hypothetical protein
MLPPTQRRNASVRGGDWRGDTGAVHQAVQLKPRKLRTRPPRKRRPLQNGGTGKDDELTSSTSPEPSL